MEHSNPTLAGVLEHVEGMYSVGLFAWELSVFSWIVNVLGPERVDSTLVEEVL